MGTSLNDIFGGGQPPKPKTIDEIFAEQDEQDRRQSAGILRVLANKPDGTPEQAGEALRLSRRMGVPPAAAIRNLDALREMSSAADFDADTFVRESPVTTRWLTADPINYSVAKGDERNLGQLERLLVGRNTGLDRFITAFGQAGLPASRQSGEAFKAPAPSQVVQSGVGQRIDRGVAITLRGQLGRLPLEELQKPEVQAEVQALDALLAEKPEEFTGISRFIAGSAEIVPTIGASMMGSSVGTVLGAGVGAVVGGFVLGPAGIPVGAAKGATIGGGLGAYYTSFTLEGGNATLDYLKMRDPEGRPINPEVAQAAGTTVGVVAGLADALSFGVLMKPFAGIRRELMAGGIAKAMREVTVQQALTNGVVAWGSSVGTEVLTETAQQGVQLAGEQAARSASNATSGTTFERIPGGRVTAELAETAVQTFVGMALIGGVGGGTRTITDLQRISQAQADAIRLGEIVGVADASELRKRDPDTFRQVVEEQTKGGLEKVGIDAERLTMLLQEQSVPVSQFAQVAGVTEQDIEEAVARGGDLYIPTANLLANVATLPIFEGMKPDLKLRPDGMSQREADEMAKEVEAEFAKIQEEMQAIVQNGVAGVSVADARAAREAPIRELEARRSALMDRVEALDEGVAPSPELLSEIDAVDAELRLEKSRLDFSEFNGREFVQVLTDEEIARFNALTQKPQVERTPEEQAEATALRKKLVDAKKSTASQASPATSAQRVIDELVAQITAATEGQPKSKRFTEANIEQTARGIAAFYITQAQRTGVDAYELYASRGYSILGRQQGEGLYDAVQELRRLRTEGTPEQVKEAEAKVRQQGELMAQSSAPDPLADIPTLYHGSPRRFESFDFARLGTGAGTDAAAQAMFLTDNPAIARFFSKEAPGNASILTRLALALGVKKIGTLEPSIYEVKVQLQNPKIVDFGGRYKEDINRILAEAKAEGHDGVVFQNIKDGPEIVHNVTAVFAPEAIKRFNRAGERGPQGLLEQAAFHGTDFLAQEGMQERAMGLEEGQLIHGTTRSAAVGIEEEGLQPQVGGFIREMYGADAEEGGAPAVFLSSGDNAFGAVNAMRAAVGREIGKKLRDVTLEDVLQYGAIAVATPNPDATFEVLEDGSARSLRGDVRYSLDVAGAEPNDFVIQDEVVADRIITGQAMLPFIASATRNGKPVFPEAAGMLGPSTAEPLGDTIDVDGVSRPTTNSTGQPIHPTAEGVRNFWRWFGDSKVVDEQGRPLVVYHGTNVGVDEFTSLPIFTTPDPAEASAYAVRSAARELSPDEPIDALSAKEQMELVRDAGVGMQVYPVYVRSLNLLDATKLGVAPSTKKAFAFLQSEGVISEDEDWLDYDNAMTGDSMMFWAQIEDADLATDIESAGFDGFRFVDASTRGGRHDAIAVLDPEQVKSALGNSGAFGPSADILMQEPLDAESGVSAEQRLQERGPIRSPRGNTYMGVIEKYTVPNPNTDAPVLKANSPLIGASTNAGNADRQSQALDALFAKHPNPLASERAWVDLANDAFSLDRIPMPPFRTLELVQQGAPAIAKEIAGLSDGMKRDAEEGLKTAQRFGKVYSEGKATPDVTAKAFLWSFLSRGVSPYVQEGAFLDAIVSDELTDIMTDAVKNGWSDALAERYSAWADKAIPEGSPGRGTQHNLNAFGKQFLRVMTQRHADAGNRTGLEIIHEMIADGTPSTQIRREFLKRGDRAGIDNKVVSFTLLLLGRTDVLVLDRVQVRNQWNDGRFDGQNIYDTEMGANEKPIAGSGFAEMTFGHKGLLYYEAMERALAPLIAEAYQSLGMEGSLGRYHWDSWLLASNQEVGHASVEGLLRDAEGKESPYVGAFVRQGKYGNYDYGFRYGVLPNGGLSTLVELLDGSGAIVVPREVMADAKHPTRKLLSKLASAAKKRGKQYGTTEPWTAGLTPAERVQYDEGIRSAGTPAPDLWQYDPDAVGREDTSGTPDPDLLPQRDAGTGAAGLGATRRPNAFIIPGVGQQTIALMNGANLSSLLHEFSHDWLVILGEQAAKPDAPAQVRADYAELLKQLGVASTAEIGVEQQENFARMWERYYATAEAPSRALARVFTSFKRWMQKVYKDVREMFVPVSPEVSRLFDRMIATDAELELARGANGSGAMLTEADGETLGATPDEMEGYANAVLWRTAQEEARLIKAVVEDEGKETTEQYQAEAESVRAEVRAELEAQPVYRAYKFLREPDASGKSVKLNVEQYEAEHGKRPRGLQGIWSTAEKAPFAKKEGADVIGTDAESMALAYGFRDGTAFIDALRAMEDLEVAVERRVREEMRVRFPDLTPFSQPLADEAQRVQHLADTDDVLVRELNLLAKSSGIRAPNVQAVKRAAKAIIAKLKVRDIRPIVYQNAEAKAARLSMEAFKAGDPEKAAFHKRQQLLNHILYREAVKQQERVGVIQRFAKRMMATPTQERMGKAGKVYQDALNSLLQSYDFRNIPLRNLDALEYDRQPRLNKTAALNAYKEAALEDALVVASIPASVSEQEGVVNYQQLSVMELDNVYSVMHQVYETASRKDKALRENEKRNLQEQADAFVESVTSLHTLSERPIDYYPLSLANAKQKLAAVDAWHLPPEFLFVWLDGDTTGTAYTLFFKPFAEAEAEEFRRGEIAFKEMQRIEEMIDLPSVVTDVSVQYEGIRSKMTKRSIIALALNMGTESGVRASLEAQVDGKPQFGSYDAILAMFAQTLTEADWKYIAAKWDYANTFWPDIAELERQTNGIIPQKLEAAPFFVRTADGKDISVKGGYYPLSYASAKLGAGGAVKVIAQVAGLEEGVISPSGGARAQTMHGWTEERVKASGRPINLDLNVWNGHIVNVIHDLTHRKAVRDVYRLYKRKNVRQTIEQSAGQEAYNALMPWLARIANPNQSFDNSFAENTIARARAGVTAVNMGLSVSVAMVQPLGYLQAADVIGPMWVAKGIAASFSPNFKSVAGAAIGAAAYGSTLGPAGTAVGGLFGAFVGGLDKASADVLERSVAMRQRREDFSRDARDYVKTRKNRLNGFEKFYFSFIGMMDNAVMVPVWIGAYRKAMAENGGNDGEAVQYADSVIRRSQGAGSPKDLSRVQGGPELRRMLTIHYSFMSRQYGLFRRTATNLTEGRMTKARVLASVAMIGVLSPILSELVAGRPPEDDEEWLPWAMLQVMRGAAGSIILLRDVARALGPKAFPYKISPVEDALKKSVGAIQTVGEQTIGQLFGDEDEELTESELKEIVETVGYWTRTPTRAIWRVVTSFTDWMQGFDVAPADFIRTPTR